MICKKFLLQTQVHIFRNAPSDLFFHSPVSLKHHYCPSSLPQISKKVEQLPKLTCQMHFARKKRLNSKKNGKISCTKAKTDLHGGTIFKHKVIKLRGKLSPVISGAFWPQAGTSLLRKLSSHLAWNTHKKTYRGAIRTAARKKIAKIVFRHFFVLEVRCFDYRPHLVSDFFPLLFCVIIPVTPNFDFYEKKPSLCY